MGVHQTRDESEWFGRVDGVLAGSDHGHDHGHDHGPVPPDAAVVEVFVAPESLGGAEMLERCGIDPTLTDVHTNSSHTPGCSVLAVAPRRVGVDAEVVRPRRRLDALARRCMLDDEFADWSEADDPLRAFLAHWTRVEAYLKALGVGIPGGLRTRPDDTWTVVDLDLGPHHLGALAVEAPAVVLSVRAIGEPMPSATPTQRFASSAVGSVLGAAMLGLGSVLHPRERDEAGIHADADSGDRDRDRLQLTLDPDDPSASVVTVRTWVERPPRS